MYLIAMLDSKNRYRLRQLVKYDTLVRIELALISVNEYNRDSRTS
jgi:hypothetical protein